MEYAELTNDVFISYAHADNTEGWVGSFHERLLHKLRQLDRKADFTIWRDYSASDSSPGSSVRPPA